jgi:SAM-dependent methyltransferase
MDESVKNLWETKGQEMELDFHKSGRGDWRWNERWDEARITLKKQFKFDFDQFAGKTLLDIGCGPKSMLDWWNGKYKYGIDPLASDYAKINPSRITSWDILDKVYVSPAEVLHEDLIGKVDFIWSHNALDHCYCWETVLDNVNQYLKVGGSVYIGTDTDKDPNPNHPGISSKEKFIAKIESMNWSIKCRYDRKDDDIVWLRTVGIIAVKE